MPRTVFEKIWDRHVVRDLGDGWALLHIDRHLLHDLSGPPALIDVTRRGLAVHNPELVFATADHAVSTTPGRTGGTFPLGTKLRVALKEQARASAIRFFALCENGQALFHGIVPDLARLL